MKVEITGYMFDGTKVHGFWEDGNLTAGESDAGGIPALAMAASNLGVKLNPNGSFTLGTKDWLQFDQVLINEFYEVDLKHEGTLPEDDEPGMIY